MQNAQPLGRSQHFCVKFARDQVCNGCPRRQVAILTKFVARVDDDLIVLRGEDDEAPGARLRGTVFLYTKDPLKFQVIKVTLSGVMKAEYVIYLSRYRTTIAYLYRARNPYSNNAVNRMDTIMDPPLEKIVVSSPPDKSSATLAAGTHRWGFQITVVGSEPGTLVGLGNTWITYTLAVEVKRPGMLASNLTDSKPIRVIRSVNSTSYQLAHDMVRHKAPIMVWLITSIGRG